MSFKRFYALFWVFFTGITTCFAPIFAAPSSSKVNKLIACGSLFSSQVQSFSNPSELPIRSALAPLLPLLRASKADPGRGYDQVSLFSHPSTLSNSQLDMVTKRIRTLENDISQDRSGRNSKAFAISGKENVEAALREIEASYQKLSTEVSVTPSVVSTAQGAKDLRQVAIGIFGGLFLTANSNIFTGALTDVDQLYFLGFKNLVALQIIALPGISWIMQNGSLQEENFSQFFNSTEALTANPVKGSVIVNSFNLHLPKSLHDFFVGKNEPQMSELKAMVLAKQSVGQTYLEKWFDDLKQNRRPKEAKYFSYFDTILYIDPVSSEPVLIIAYRGFPQIPEGQLSNQELDNLDINSRYFPK